MKNNITICCRRCGYEKDFYLGVGLLHVGPPDFDSEYAVLPRLVGDEKRLLEIKKQVDEQGAALETDYRYGVYRCGDCGAFYKKFDYTLVFEDGLKKAPGYFCDCGQKLEKVDIETLDLRSCGCPECGEKSLYEGISSFTPLD